jgi:FkbM family methyltransferase
MLRILKKGDVALDVGCHKGGWLYWMRKAVGPTGQVHAFEPQPALAAYLQEVVAAFGWENVFVHACALGDHQGSTVLHVPDSTGSTSASASLVAEVANNESGGSPTPHTVPVSTLDHFAEQHGLTRIDFIKIDVEGFELETLTGAQKTLTTQHPTLLVECEARHLQPGARTMSQVFDQILPHNYTGTFFNNGQPTPLKTFQPTLHQNQSGDRFWDHPNYANNFLFEPNSATPQA